MSLRQEAEMLAEIYRDQKASFTHNQALFDIYEGDLMKYLEAAIRDQLNEVSADDAMTRAAPINVLRKLIDKLSRIYAKPPQRKVVDGSDNDQELTDWYTEKLELNTSMGLSNEFFNLHKRVWVEPYFDRDGPSIRVLPANLFFVHSNDYVNPLRPTHFGKVMGTVKRDGVDKALLFLYTAQEFLAVDEDGQVVNEIMQRDDIAKLNGANPLGRLPGVYINRSRHLLTPKDDTDTLELSTLIPVILTDLNYAVKYQCFSMNYTIDCDSEQLTRAPNAMLMLKSDPESGKTPSVGSIKPEVDTDKVIQLVKTLLSMWMTTRNIKPGAMGDLTTENAASGIAKAIDESDTSEDRTKQIPYFVDAERELFDLIAHAYHPLWVKEPAMERKDLFTAACKLAPTFAEQRPIVDSSKAIADQKELIAMGLQSKRGALKELYPDWTEAQIDERLAEVANVQSAQPTVEPVANDNGGLNDGNQDDPAA
jgi:hypothetical protein